MGESEFWSLTIQELDARLEKIAERIEARERAATLRAGLVASAVYNVNRKKGSRMIRPKDFLRGSERRLTPEEARDRMDAWARSQNKRHEA